MTRSDSRSVWLKADDSAGDWERRKKRITAGLEAGVDWVLCDRRDVARVRELGAVNVAAFDGEDDGHLIDAEADSRSVDASDASNADVADTESSGSDASDAGIEMIDGSDADTDIDTGASPDANPSAEVDANAGTEADGPDATVVGKGGEGDGTVDFPPDFAGSVDLSALRGHSGAVNGAYVRVLSADYERFAEAAVAEAEYTIVVGEDWRIIPLENLIARIGEETTLIAGVESAEEARTAFETLESGADAVLLDSEDPDEIRKTVEARDDAARERLDLTWATVTAVEGVGSADRVCVDTGSLLDDDEGLLVGSMSRGLFFVHAETAQSPYVAARPFRVNAGAVHAYVRAPDGTTSYLAELGSGDEVQVVDLEGDTREAIVGRAKIERRPMFRVEAEVDATDAAGNGGPEDDEGNGERAPDRIETLLQNAETIKVATREGRKAVTDLERDDEVLVFYEGGARHFGEAIEESIIEK